MRKIPQIDENERGIARYRATPDASRPRANDATATSVDDGSGGDEPRFQLEAPAISLPKGGGAIKGIDEKFTVNASNGTLSLSLPLPLTPARNGAAPPLRLSYDTGAGNSVVGLGWSLELASVRRGTDRFIPRYDADDVFLLTGGDDLVPAMNWDGADWVPDEEPPGDLTVKRYRPRVDRDFARIEQISDGADTWWRVMSRENVTTFFGIDEHSRIVDPERPSRVYEWLPAISFDDQGNCVVYEYKPDDMAGVTATQAEANRLSEHRLSTSFSHIADRASEEPTANSKELWEIYATLRRARAARYGSTVPGDLDAASAAITDVVRAEDSCAISNMANLEVTDFRGNRMSYAQALAKRTHDTWSPQDIDVSFTSGETWTYRQKPAQVCPVPAR